MAELTRDERDALCTRAIDMDEQRFTPGVADADYHRLSESFYLAVADYFDALPRRVLSVCPYCGEPLVRAFDPWGVDGPWWGEDKICNYAEPAPCAHFQALLGALMLEDAAIPARMQMDAQPGPQVPFVVPRVMALPGIVAVVGRVVMERGGPAYPIGYFSDQALDPAELHQEWRRTMLWYQRDGQELWTAKYDVWDFELAPWVAADRLRWTLLEETPPRVYASGDGACPFVGLAGERAPQIVSAGDRDFLPPPDGSRLNPFEEDGGV